MDQAVRKLIAHEGSCLRLAPSGSKVLCTLTGHELALQHDTIQTFIKGRKYQRLKAAAEAKEALRKYEPFLVQSRNFEDKLYCALTCQLLAKSLDAVRQHMGGKKFQRAKERYQNDELELMEEPSLRDSPPHTEAAAPMEGQEGPGGSAAPADAAAAAAEADGLWVPDEYVEMEAQAATEAAEAVHSDGPHEAAGGEGASPPAGLGSTGGAPMVNGTGVSSSTGRRPKKPKPKHKAKKQRLA